MFVDRDALASKGQTAPTSRAQVGARAVWRDVGITSISKRGTRGDLITVDDSIRPMILELIEQIGPAVADSINLHFVPVAEAMFDGWPDAPPAPPVPVGNRPNYGSYRTDLSKSMLALEIGVAPDGFAITASLVARAPYALFIDRGAVVRDLIWTPGREAADRMAVDIVGNIQ
jgi:hypothetical protein